MASAETTETELIAQIPATTPAKPFTSSSTQSGEWHPGLASQRLSGQPPMLYAVLRSGPYRADIATVTDPRDAAWIAGAPRRIEALEAALETLRDWFSGLHIGTTEELPAKAVRLIDAALTQDGVG